MKVTRWGIFALVFFAFLTSAGSTSGSGAITLTATGHNTVAGREVLPQGSIGPTTTTAGRTLDSLRIARLLPVGAHLYRRWPIRASAGEPPQLVVMWQAPVMDAPQGGPLRRFLLWRVVLWTRSARLSATSWRWRAFGVMVTRYPGYVFYEQLRLVDLTGDGHPEVLSHWSAGNHNIGPFSVVATLSGRPRCVLCAAGWFEAYWHVHDGILRIDSGDYRGAQSLCCPRGEFHTTYKWNGTRLVAVRRTRTTNHF